MVRYGEETNTTGRELGFGLGRQNKAGVNNGARAVHNKQQQSKESKPMTIDNIIRMSAFYKSIIPIKTDGKGKTPAVRWKKDTSGRWPTHDEEIITKWWTKHPDHNVGCVIGENWWVLDLDISEDGQKNGIQTIENLGFNIEQLRDSTFWVTTPRGGMHLYFRWDDNCNFKTASDVISSGSGIDTRTPLNSYVRIFPTPGFMYHNQPSQMSQAPKELIELLNKSASMTSKEKREVNERPAYSDSQVKEMLSYIKPEAYRSRSDWMELMIDVHAASGGSEEGKNLFKDWSLQDDYPYDEDPDGYIDVQWETLDAQGARTGRVLESKANRAGMSDIKFDVIEKPEDTVEEDKEDEIEKDELNIPYFLNKQGELRRTDQNLMLLMTSPVDHEGNPSIFNGLYYYDELREDIMYSRVPPWMPPETKLEDLTKSDECAQELKIQLEVRYDISFSLTSLDSLIAAAAKRDRRNPVIDYLDNLPKWDGVPRVADIFVRVGGAADNEYHHKVALHMLISAVARAYDPGCKVDTMTVIEGPQGQGKSSLVQALAGEFYCLPDMNAKGKDAIAAMRGWLNEWAELMGHNRKEVEAIKTFISNPSDTYRPAYGRHAQTFKRRSILIATVNPEGAGDYLTDSTGGRRFNPVYCPNKNFDAAWLKQHRDMLFAEAKQRYFDKEPWYFLPNEVCLAQEEQEKRTATDTWTDQISDWLSTRYENGATSPVEISNVAYNCLGIAVKDQTGYTARRIGVVLKQLGYEQIQKRIRGTRRRVFMSPKQMEEYRKEKALEDLEGIE